MRVSGKAQLDGYGLDAQKREVRAWAKRNGHRITTWHADEAVSGTTDALDRDGLAGALQDVCGGRVDGIVVARLDRVARSLTVQEAALAHVWRCGGRVFTADGGEVVQDDPDDPMRTAMRQVMGAFSQLERGMIVKRLRNGRREKAAQGGYAQGRPPYGYRAEGGELVPDDAEQFALKQMRRMRDRGKSYREIATALTAKGMAPRQSDRWHAQTVARIVERV